MKAYAVNKDVEERVKIGIYEYEPCIIVDSDGNINGYFDDFFKLISEEYDFKYEYVLCSLSEGLEKLENGEIDIMPGIPVIENNSGIIYNKYSILNEKFGIYSNKYDNINQLQTNNVIKLGLVKDNYNVFWILEIFKTNDINVEIISANTYEELEDLLNKNEIDLMVDNLYKKNKYNMIYEFASKPIYIAGNENSKVILNNIDNAIYNIDEDNEEKLNKLYIKCFEPNHNVVVFKNIILVLILTVIPLIALMITMIPRIKKKITVNKIKNRMHKEQYLLQYQPIYNPRNKQIIGFEGLLRLRGENNKLVPPYEFISEIESNNMLFDMSIWILKKAIKDYKKIEDFPCVKGRDFYISVNISLNEIENDNFVKKIIHILLKSNLKHNSICLEIIERVKLNDIDKITKNIDYLKNAGFKIAIDDFGVEYSNLDVLQKLDVDTIKVDKNFVDGVGKDIIRNEIILFISKIASVKNRSIVLEGVEEASQHTAIKQIKNELLYVQGYYYSKPIYIEQIKAL